MRKRYNARCIVPHKRNAFFMFLASALLLISSLCIASGKNDLLLLPAKKSEMASASMLTDVVKIKTGLVAVGERGHILYRGVEETQWHQADVPVRVNFTAVSFPTDSKGWAVGHDGVILHSEDGGGSWKKQIDGSKINELMLIQLKKIIADRKRSFEDSTSQLSAEQLEDLSLEIVDLEFFLKDLETAEKEGPSRPLLDVWFKNEREGIAVGAYGMIIQTKDGGKNWIPMLDRIDNSTGYHYYGIAQCGSDLFIAGEYGMLYRSENFGESWQRLSSPYEGSFFGILGKTEGDYLVAFGLRGTIISSYDRGATWSFAKTNTKASISGGTFLSDGSLCLVATDGTILHGTNDGKNLVPLSKRFPGSIAVTELGNDLIVVGLKGVIRVDLNHSSTNTKG